MLFFGKKDAPGSRSKSYDHQTQTPVLRCSICNGEKVAGFQDKQTGAFAEVMLIRTEEDLEAFRTQYGISGEIRRIY